MPEADVLDQEPILVDTDKCDEFFLSEDCDNFVVVNACGECVPPTWDLVEKKGSYHVALLVSSGHALRTNRIRWSDNTWIYCNWQLEPKTQNDAVALVIEAWFIPIFGSPLRLISADLCATGLRESSVLVDASTFRGGDGSLEIRISSTANNDNEKLAIVQFVVATQDRLGLLKARTHKTRRIQRELEHFKNVYDHKIYAQRNKDRQTGMVEAPISIIPLEPRVGQSDEVVPLVSVNDLLDLDVALVRDTDDVYHYAHRVLGVLLKIQPPDFSDRIKQIYSRTGVPVRLMSLCSGAAGVERQLISAAGCPVEITLFDINEELMRQAATGLAPISKVFGVVGDVNRISTAQFGGQRFDVIACVSGLHHVVELEHVLGTASALLAEEGEFWIIGEQVGRDGNQLWPEAAEVANAIFQSLPESLRLNAHTGTVDERLQECDFSAISFEGIRSSEIEALLSRYFEPVHLYRRNCFLWRVVNPTYFANYDLHDEDHRRVVLSLVAAEYNLWKRGGRSTESHSVYRRR